jgi:hypothetical protein
VSEKSNLVLDFHGSDQDPDFDYAAFKEGTQVEEK